VLYHLKPDVVRQHWVDIRRANGEDIPDIPPDEDDVSDDEEGLADGSDHEGSTGAANGKASSSTPVCPPVGYFQQALSAAWKALPRAEQKEYERKAMEWRLDGPDEAMQQT
jgi:hypothetical protein